MSAISELREKVNELEARIDVLETAVLKLLNEGNGIQNHSGELHRIEEVRTPIGYRQKVTKR